MTEVTQETSAQDTAGAKVALTDGRGGILGVKAGMTQVYAEDGGCYAVTVIDLSPNVITQVKTMAKEGYNAVQVGVLEKKASRVNKAETGHFKKAGQTGFYYVKEFRLPEDAKMAGLTAGTELSPEFVKEGDYVDLTSTSKGKGTQGGMKRFHMSGSFKTHGASVNHRSLGSIGQRGEPGKCFKNRKMPGQMGNVKRTVQNVKVIKIDMENGLLLVHGSVPGPKSGIVTVRRAVRG